MKIIIKILIKVTNNWIHNQIKQSKIIQLKNNILKNIKDLWVLYKAKRILFLVLKHFLIVLFKKIIQFICNNKKSKINKKLTKLIKQKLTQWFNQIE